MLSLPISSATGVSVAYIDALFTATTATCVTGLVSVTTASAWSFFGQLVILLLIQIGGLGIITVLSAFLIMMGKRVGLNGKLLIMDSFNLSSLSGLIEFIKKVVVSSLVIEAVGAVLYMSVFVPQFGLRGIWISIFNSVSAFCNAGMDIISDTSLCAYVENPIVNCVTCSLVILGGIGFVVWWDIAKIWKNKHTRHFSCLSLHSKIVLITTLVFVILGAASTLAFEYNNPDTLGNLSLFGKIQASLFQSVTTRTAGFATIPQEGFTTPSVLVYLLLMFIGGSPVGTAGGIKTTAFFIIIATALSSINGRKDTVSFGRKLSDQSFKKAIAVVFSSFVTLFVSTLILASLVDVSLTDILYETVSATATVGLSRNLTTSLDLLGKITIIFTMYFGRVGPISLALAFKGKQKGEVITVPAEEIII